VSGGGQPRAARVVADVAIRSSTKAAVVVRVTNVFVCHSGDERGKDVVLT